MDERAETRKQAMAFQQSTREEARITLDEVRERAFKAYKESKKQADTVYKEVKKLAVDKQAKKAVGQAHKEAVKQAENVRDAIVAEALVVLLGSWGKSQKDHDETIRKGAEAVAQADKGYREAKNKAELKASHSKGGILRVKLNNIKCL